MVMHIDARLKRGTVKYSSVLFTNYSALNTSTIVTRLKCIAFWIKKDGRWNEWFIVLTPDVFRGENNRASGTILDKTNVVGRQNTTFHLPYVKQSKLSYFEGQIYRSRHQTTFQTSFRISDNFVIFSEHGYNICDRKATSVTSFPTHK